MREVYLITKNKGKLIAAQSVFMDFDIKLLPVEKNYPEIQAETSLEIAKYTAVQAALEMNYRQPEGRRYLSCRQ